MTCGIDPDQAGFGSERALGSLRGADRLRERGVLSAGVPLPNASVTALYPGNTEAERAATVRRDSGR